MASACKHNALPCLAVIPAARNSLHTLRGMPLGMMLCILSLEDLDVYIVAFAEFLCLHSHFTPSHKNGR